MLDPFDADEVDVSFVSTRNGSFWHRLKWAARYLWGREDLVLADAIFPKSTLTEVMEGLARDDD